MPTIQESIKVFNQVRNGEDFLLNPLEFTTVVKANVGEKIKIVSKFRVFWELVADVITSDTLTVAVVAGGNSLTSAKQNFETAGFRVGGTYTHIINSGANAGTYPGQIITLVNGNYLEFTLLGALLPGVSSDATIKGTTNLDTLTYKFNFPASSNSQNLVSDVFGLIPSFTYKGMVIIGGDIAGVATKPDYWNGGSSLCRRLATVNTYEQVYEVETIIVIPDYKEGQFDDIKGRDIVIPFVVETQFYKEAIDLRLGENFLTTRPFDITRSINDSIGWLNENFDGGPRQYSMVSLSYEELTSGDARDSIEVTESTKVNFVIASNGTTFATTDPFVISFRNLYPESVYNVDSVDFNVTNNRESLRGTIDGGPVSGTILTQLDVALNGPNEIIGSVVVVFTQDQKDRQDNDNNYLLAIDLTNPSTGIESSNRLNLIMDADSVSKNSDIPGLFSVTKDEVYYLKDEFIEGVSAGNTDFVAWNETVFMRDIEFDLVTEDGVTTTITELHALIIAYNPVTNLYFEIQRVSVPLSSQVLVKTTNVAGQQHIAINTTRGFLLPEGSQFNYLRANNKSYLAPNQKFSAQIGIMMPWQPWEKLLNVDTVFFNANEPNNGLNLLTSHYSEQNDYEIRLAVLGQVQKNNAKGEPILTDYLDMGPAGQVFDFDLDKNITPKYTTSFAYIDKNSNTIPKSAIKNEDVTIIATFDSAIVETSPDFEASIKIEVKEQGTERSKHIITTVEGVIDNDILKPLLGETLLNKSVVGDNFTAQCIINGALLNSKFWSPSAELIEDISFVFTCPGGETYYDAVVNDNGGEPDTVALYGISLVAYKQAIDDYFCSIAAFLGSMVGMYLFTGGTAATHAINAANPGTFNLNFIGSPPQGAGGFGPLNGTTQYANTGIDAFNNMASNMFHLSALNTVNYTAASGSYIGAVNSGTQRNALVYSSGAGLNTFYAYDNSLGSVAGGAAVDGFVLGSMRSSSDREIYFDGVSQASTATVGGSRSALDMFIGALNITGTPTQFSPFNFQFASAGDDLTDAEVLTLHNAVAAFQTALNR